MHRAVQIASATVALIFFLAPVSADSATVYKCDIKDAAQFDLDGTLRKPDEKKMERITPIIVDVVSGVVRMGKTETASRWKVVQKAPLYDWVLERTEEEFPDEIKDDAIIRIGKVSNFITPKSKGQTLIIHYDTGALYTGLCRGLD